MIAQTRVIRRAILELHEYLERKKTEVRMVELQMRALDPFNHRQVEIIRQVLKHPGQRYTMDSHQTSHQISHMTARSDLVALGKQGILSERAQGKLRIFIAPADLPDRLLRFGSAARKASHGPDSAPAGESLM